MGGEGIHSESGYDPPDLVTRLRPWQIGHKCAQRDGEGPVKLQKIEKHIFKLTGSGETPKK